MKISTISSEYNDQANQFLADTSTSFSIEYLYTGLYFSSDTEPRDIYQFTLKNDKGAYSAKFGDSINNTIYNRTYNRKKRALCSSLFPQFKPSAYDVLSAIGGYCPDTFEDFCDEYGYSEQPLTEHDNIMRIFLSVREETQAITRMFTPEQIEKLAEIA